MAGQDREGEGQFGPRQNRAGLHSMAAGSQALGMAEVRRGGLMESAE